MSKLEFLEINRNFKSYYKTLRDVNYYLTSNSELNNEKLHLTSQIISELIYSFIRTNGTTFREMDQEQYVKDYDIFYEDFLDIIVNSGESNVDFDGFTALIDELIGVANLRATALRKIKKSKQPTDQFVSDIQAYPDVSQNDVDLEENDEAENVMDVEDIVETEPKIDQVIETSSVVEQIASVESKENELKFKNSSEIDNILSEEILPVNSEVVEQVIVENEAVEVEVNKVESEEIDLYRPRRNRFS